MEWQSTPLNSISHGLKILVSVVRFRPGPPYKIRLAAMQAFFLSVALCVMSPVCHHAFSIKAVLRASFTKRKTAGLSLAAAA